MYLYILTKQSMCVPVLTGVVFKFAEQYWKVKKIWLTEQAHICCLRINPPLKLAINETSMDPIDVPRSATAKLSINILWLFRRKLSFLKMTIMTDRLATIAVTIIVRSIVDCKQFSFVSGSMLPVSLVVNNVVFSIATGFIHGYKKLWIVRQRFTAVSLQSCIV